jgi:acyl-CoA synthetase (AMP-forming)/AMP-acid ligase II
VLVRGANVMRGYLGRDDLTAAAMHDGSYVTGDLGHVDEDGFLFLSDRLSRFSKIGGGTARSRSTCRNAAAATNARSRCAACRTAGRASG